VGPVSFDAPVLASVNLWAFVLSLAAIVAMFRFRIGMLPTLSGTSVVGIALYMGGFIT
jgi:chromate transporter